MLINAYPAQTPQKKKSTGYMKKIVQVLPLVFFLLSCPSLYTTFHCIMQKQGSENLHMLEDYTEVVCIFNLKGTLYKNIKVFTH